MIVCYTSSHGWGHNARLLPIINELTEYPVEIVSSAPKWFIDQLLNKKRKYPIKYREMKTDPGCIQKDPFLIDIEQSIRSWKEIFQLNVDRVEVEVELLKKRSNVVLIISDISYFGQLVSEKLGIPSICIATFDWSFIYQSIRSKDPEFDEIIKKVQEISSRFDYCFVPGTKCTPLTIGKKQEEFNWSSRKPSVPRPEMRQKLGLGLYDDSALMSFGGHQLMKLDPQIWNNFPDIIFFVLLPKNECVNPPAPNVRFLPSEEWTRYHTDLINTVDVVFGKIGYGLISEVVACRKPFLNVRRIDNPESQFLEKFVHKVVPVADISPEDFISGNWNRLYPLMDIQRDPLEYEEPEINGEDQIANRIRSILGKPKPQEKSYLMFISIIVLIVSLVIWLYKH